jgi:Response regulator receiver domain
MVLDVALPGLSGLDLQKLVADRTDMPIIFLTGHGDVATTVQAMKAGALEFLTKPFRPDLLVSAIREALERSRQALARDAAMKSLRESYASLSRREREVMALVVAGLLNPVAVVDLVDAQAGLEHERVRDHRIVVRVGVFRDVEIPLHPAPGVRDSRWTCRRPSCCLLSFGQKPPRESTSTSGSPPCSSESVRCMPRWSDSS